MDFSLQCHSIQLVNLQEFVQVSCIQLFVLLCQLISAVCLHYPGLRYIPEEDIMMMVDSCEDDWLSLHDIRLNGPILEYVGRGKSVADVGLAQAKHPICTRHHYFEIEVRT